MSDRVALAGNSLSYHPCRAAIADLASRINSQPPALQWVVVGTGMMGREHIQACWILGQAEIYGIYDPSEESIAATLALFERANRPPPRRFVSLEEIAADATVDAVIISTPNYTHKTIFDQLEHSGLPMLIEKPMATTLDDALYLANAARRHPAVIQMGMQYRYKSQYQLALQTLRAGSLGDIKMVSMSEYRPPFLNKIDQWNKFEKYSGGTLVEKCCHYFDLINQFAGAFPARVFAFGGQAVNFLDFQYGGDASDIHDHAMVMIEFENHVIAQFTLNMFSRELSEELHVGGSEGRLHAREDASFDPNKKSRANIKIEVPGHPYYDGVDCTYPEPIELAGHYGSTLFEHDRFVRQSQGEVADAATIEQGLWAIITASMAQRAIETRSVVDVRQALAGLQIDPYDFNPFG